MDRRDTLAEAAIKSVLIRERFYRDSCQWDKLRSTYHPDPSKTSLNITWYNGDIDGFIRGSQQMATGAITVIHTINPVDIDIRGFRAFAVSVGNISARFEQDGRAYDLVSQCRFLSRLEEVEVQSGRTWNLLTMEVIYVYDSIIPAFPETEGGKLIIGVMPETTRKSYRYLSWLLSVQGREVNAHLPGIDDEESVREVMDRNKQWLNS